MRSTHYLLVSLFTALAFGITPLQGYALQQQFWVAPGGDDAQSCTEAAPCRTINHVMQALVSDGDIVTLEPGIYREQVNIVHDNLTLQGAAPGVFLYGATPPALQAAEGKYVAPWSWGTSFQGTAFCNNLTDDVGMDGRRCNTRGFWQSGVRLDEVLSKAEVVAGTFYFDGDANEVWLQPHAGDDNLQAIEGATHAYALKLTGASSGVTLRDLNIWYGTSMPDDGVLQIEGSGHVLENISVKHSAGAGILVFGADDVTMTNVEAAGHGQNGWRVRADASFSTTSGWQINDWVDALIVNQSASTANGWKGYDNCWGGGGTKFSFTRDLQVDAFYSADNNGFGLWLDIENHTYDITSSLSARDTGRGIFVEYISDNGRVENNVVFNTRDADHIGCGISVGLAAADSRDVLIKNNTVYTTADDVKGLMLKTGCPTCRSFPYASERITWENNLLVNKGDAGFVRDLDAGSPDPFTYSNTVIEASFVGDGTVAVCWDNLGNCSTSAFDIETLSPGTYLADASDECGFAVTTASIEDVGAQSFVHPRHTAVCGDDLPATPPDAGFSYEADGLEVTFMDTSTDANDVIAWSWSFGDGATSDVQHPIHTYAASGAYTVLLTVTNAAGLSDTASNLVSVEAPAPPQEPPVADFSYTTDGLSAQFEDRSTDDGMLVSWLWTFGEGGQSTVQHPAYTYAEAGTYPVTLTVEDDAGLTASLTMEIVVVQPDQPEPPLPAFDYVMDGLSVTFDDTSSDDGVIVAWLWEFGDGAVATLPSVVHTYDQAGTYQVQLTVTDDEGLSASVSQTIVLDDMPATHPPDAAFTFIIDGLTVTFLDESTDTDGEVVSWQWDFGDGETASIQHPVYTFQAAGSYYVSLQVTDNVGLTSETGVQLMLSNDDEPLGTFVEVAGMVVMEAEHHTTSTPNTSTGDVWIPQHVTLNNTVAEAMQPLPDNGDKITVDIQSQNAGLHYPIYVTTTGTYYIWIRMAPQVGGGTLYAGTTTSASLIGYTRVDASADDWIWHNRKNEGRRAQVNITETGEQLIELWMREDGLIVDRLLLTTDASYTPEGVGPDESFRILFSPNKATPVPDRTLSISIPAALDVKPFYPNPASNVVYLPVDLPTAAQVSVVLYDMAGRHRFSHKAFRDSGQNQVSLHLSGVTAGVYLARITIALETGAQTFSRRLVVVPQTLP